MNIQEAYEDITRKRNFPNPKTIYLYGRKHVRVRLVQGKGGERF